MDKKKFTGYEEALDDYCPFFKDRLCHGSCCMLWVNTVAEVPNVGGCSLNPLVARAAMSLYKWDDEDKQCK